MHFLYNIAIAFYSFGLRIASLFHPKAKLWVEGRQNLLNELEQWRSKNEGDLIWIHCASLGEFEQGRPIIEAIKRENVGIKILLTFFSPSGYEVRKDYALADYVCYLPSDKPKNAQKFIEALQPKAALIVKYEYWANYFFQCKKQQIPLVIVSGILRKEQRFFGVFSSFWKKVLNCVTHFFVQNEETQKLLFSVGITNVTIAGDSRFDRVVEIANNAKQLDEIALFKGNSFCVVAGSSWPQEEEILQQWLESKRQENIKLIVVPHEISDNHIDAIQKLFSESIKWSERSSKDISSYKVLVVDTIGMLTSIYRYADVAIIGGGFGKGIHNTLEAAVWGIPVLFGPNFQKFEEAKQLVNVGGAFPSSTNEQLGSNLSRLYTDSKLRNEAGKHAKAFCIKHKGATQKITTHLDEQKLL